MPTADGSGLRFNILGPLEGWTNGQRLHLGGLIQKRVLATLLLDPGKVLPIFRLVEAAWPEDPPATASHQVRKTVADLRQRIPGGGEVILTDGPGYAAVLTDAQLDLREFDVRVREARKKLEGGDRRGTVEILRTALALWRGSVLSGVGGRVIEAAATALNERHLTAVEQYFDLRLALGETSDLIGDLRDQISRHPFQEALRGQLMLALYRSGRRAEALEEYGKVRGELAEELGIDPGLRLAKLHENILADNPVLAGTPESARPVAPPPVPVPTPAEAPRTLPYDLADFTGRDQELRWLLSSARRRERGTRAVAIDGMGGTGKTSLAVHAAHRLSADYPDGQIYIDLRGYTLEERPVTVSTALEVLLRGLGLPGDRIPDDVAARVTLWQSALAGKRLLILLDNAADASVVSRLVPTSPGCLVLVTSRARLTDLDGAEWISIDVMAPRESEALVTELLTAQRIDAEPEAVSELARLCGHLPLALRIATARLSNRPLWSPSYLVERLRDENRKLDELSSGERGVATSLRLSYQVLAEDCRTTFRSLSLHPGRDIDVYSAAALLALDVRKAEGHLEKLLDAHLVQQPTLGLYAFHDLVRSFARSLAAPDAGCDVAIERMLGYYLTATEAACEVLFPGRNKRPTGISRSTARLPSLTHADEAQAWFAREHLTLMSVANLAAKGGYHRHVVFLNRNVGFYVNARGNLEEFAELSRTAVAAARRIGDPGLLGMSLSNLAVACWKLGLHTEGIAVAQEGRELAISVGDRHTQAHSEGALGLYESLAGHFTAALRHLRAAVALEHELGAPRAEVESLTLLSALYEQWGRYEEAAEAAGRAVALVRRLGRHETALVAFTDLAFAQVGLGEYAAAEESLAEARQMCDEKNEPGHVAMILALSAEVAHRRGDPERALAYADRTYPLLGLTASPMRRAKVENILGRLQQNRRDYAAALRLHTHAHGVASAINYRVEAAYALSGMAHAAGALGDERAAAEHQAAAEELFEALGVPENRRRRLGTHHPTRCTSR